MKKPQLVNSNQWFNKEKKFCIVFNTRWGTSKEKLTDLYVDTYCSPESKTPWGITKGRKYDPEDFDSKKHGGLVCKECTKAYKIMLSKKKYVGRPPTK